MGLDQLVVGGLWYTFTAGTCIVQDKDCIGDTFGALVEFHSVKGIRSTPVIN